MSAPAAQAGAGRPGRSVSMVVPMRNEETSLGHLLDLALPALREWCKSRLSVYKVPQRLILVKELPRNAMGKVTKPAIRGLFG